MYEFCTDYKKMLDNIITSACTYITDNKIEALIIGMSGGIDSTLTAAIAYEVAKLLKGQIKVIGRVIDINSNKEEINRGVEAANAFCHVDDLIDLSCAYHILFEDLLERDFFGLNNKKEVTKEELHSIKVRAGNVKARLRMIQLYDLAKKYNGMVLSTDNYTEYLLGFWTLHGDVGDFGMIQSLWKTEVYGVATYMMDRFNALGMFGQEGSLKACINAVPTDGLGITRSDFDQIYPEANKNGSPRDIYHIVDTMLYDGVIEQKDEENAVILKHKATEFKRNNPYNIKRESVLA